MNREQRTRISEAFADLPDAEEVLEKGKTEDGRNELIGFVEGIKDKLGDVRDEEQEKFDNMPEGLQNSEKGQAINDAAESLDSIIDGGQLDTVIESLKNEYPDSEDIPPAERKTGQELSDAIEEWADGIVTTLEEARDKAEGL